jgi:hypothetical protein
MSVVYNNSSDYVDNNNNNNNGQQLVDEDEMLEFLRTTAERYHLQIIPP